MDFDLEYYKSEYKALRADLEDRHIAMLGAEECDYIFDSEVYPLYKKIEELINLDFLSKEQKSKLDDSICELNGIIENNDWDFKSCEISYEESVRIDYQIAIGAR